MPIVSFQWVLVIIIILASPLTIFRFLTLFFLLVFVVPKWLVNVLPMLSLFFIISIATSLLYYVDDFGGCDAPQNAPSAYHALELLFHLLGLESAGDKDCSPSTLMIFLGILFNTLTMTMSIPAEKLSELLTKIRKVYHQHYISLHKLQSLLSLMAFVTSCVHPALIFMAALLNGLHSLQRSEFLYLNDEIKSNLQWWLAFLPQYNGISLIPPSVYCADTTVTDACLIGAGGVFGNECFHTTFPDHIIKDTDYNISVKEILAIIVALHL